MILSRKTKKLLDTCINETIKLSFMYLKKVLNQYNLELPNNIKDIESYTHELTLLNKSLKGTEQ